MNTQPDAGDHSVTLLEWLDAFARGTTPLPRYSIFVKRLRSVGVARVILAWTFTLAALAILAIGTLYSGVFIASWYYVYPAIGFWIWHITMILVAVLGMLAFISVGRFPESGFYGIGSLVLNYCYIFAQFGLASLEPLLMIPPAVLINGAHAYVLWRFILSQQMKKEPAGPD